MTKRAELAQRDVEALMLREDFKRFVSTIFQTSGMHTGAYGADGRHLQFLEGRRSLGFDILRTIERAQPDALLQVLQAELTALKEYPDNGRSSRRTAELDDGNDDREPRAGSPAVLDYDAAD